MSGFSSALKLTDLNDFIQPSQACIKPVESSAKKAKSDDSAGVTDSGDDPGDDGIKINRSKGWKARKALQKTESPEPEKPKTPLNVTLGDCLACSGCITSAEAVLIAEQSHEKVLEVLDKKAKDPSLDLIVVVSFSLQSIASLAAKSQLSMQTTAERLAYFFHDLGVDYVLDIALARHLCLVESAREFVRRHDRDSTGQQKQTLLSSTCPGFVCYAEKSQGTILVPMLSEVKSPQQIMGLLVKKKFDLIQSSSDSVKPKANNARNIYHITLMPCYDKKLEASRLDNRLDDPEQAEPIPEVDCVITPIELEKLLQMKEINLSNLPSRALDHFYPKFYPEDQDSGHLALRSHLGSGAGGYAENLFRFVAAELYGDYLKKLNEDLEFPKLSWRTIRNADFLELKLYENGTTDGTESEQKVLLSFAILNGFRNVQNLVSRVKRKTCSYDYVEVSACPKGCLNGGAQLRDIPPDPSSSPKASLDPASIAFEQVQRLYDQLPKNPDFGLELPEFQLEQIDSENRKLYEALQLDQSMLDQMRTKFQVVEKTFNILNSNW